MSTKGRPAARGTMKPKPVKQLTDVQLAVQAAARAIKFDATATARNDGERLAELSLCLPFPPSTNTYWRHLPGGKTLISEAGRKYRAFVQGVALMHKLAGSFPNQRLRVILQLIPPDKRRRDIDNSCKALFDAFTHAKIWGDDEQVDVLHIIKRGDSNPGFVLVSIEAIYGN